MHESIFPDAAANLTIAELLFRTCCATGWAVAQHLQDLRSASDVSGMLSWRKILREIDTQVITQGAAWAVADSTLDETVQFARGSLENIARSLPRRAGRSELERVLLEISSDIILKSADDLKQEFDEINAHSFALANECIESSGGVAAKNRWMKCEVAKLRFERRSKLKCFLPTTVRGGKQFIVQIGGEGFSLAAYLTLEFQLLHEYLSHVFPVWDSEGSMFSEADLFALARWKYPQFTDKGTHILVVNADERQRFAQMRGEPSAWEDRREELLNEIRGRWVGESALDYFLLELGATDDNSMPVYERNQLLDMLYSIHKLEYKRPRIRQEEVRALFEGQPDLVALRWELGKVLQLL